MEFVQDNASWILVLGVMLLIMWLCTNPFGQRSERGSTANTGGSRIGSGGVITTVVLFLGVACVFIGALVLFGTTFVAPYAG